MNETRSVYKIMYSSHRIPRLTPVKEIRTTKKSNEVQCFLMSEKYDAPRTMSSMDELVHFAAQFFSSVICNGLPFDPHTNDVKKMVSGYKNALNRWQSTKCSSKIEVTGWSFCLRCDKLRKALAMQNIRYFITFIRCSVVQVIALFDVRYLIDN